MILYVIIKIMKNVFYVPIWNNLKDVLYSDKSKIHKNKHSMLPHVKKRNTFLYYLHFYHMHALPLKNN